MNTLRRRIAAVLLSIGGALCASDAVASRLPFDVSGSGNGVWSSQSCGDGCTEYLIGTSNQDYQSASCATFQNGVTFFMRYPSFVNRVTVQDYAFKDWIHFKVNGTTVFDPDARWTGNDPYCLPSFSSSKTGTANVDVTSYLRNVPEYVYVYFTLDTSYVLRGHGFIRLRVEYTPVMACQDGEDNDRDGKVDYPNEPGCTSYTDDDEGDPTPKPLCGNGIDDEGDGFIDYPRDTTCRAASENYEGPPACQDGIDNDNDGKTDYPNEPGCESRDDISEPDPSPKPICSNGVDDDGDGLTDYPADPTCVAASSTSEGPIPQCMDGRDNDGNGRADFPNDQGCLSRTDRLEGPTEPCANCMCGADLNGDGAPDSQGETATCKTTADGGSMCPLQEEQCQLEGTNYFCPSDRNRPCSRSSSGTVTCSRNQCASATSTSNPIEYTDINQPPPANDGPRGSDGSCLGTLRLFPGQGVRCRKAGTQTAFQGCCNNRRGRLQDTMGERGGKTQTEYKKEANDFNVFANQCDIQDQKTSQLADSGYCIELGEYCAEKWVFGCVQRARSYCCFNSKLAKLIQEQGRQQIPSMGGFGDRKNPNCRGFTINEFQALDFSKIDLSSYYSDFRTESQTMIQQDAQNNARQNTGR